VVETALARALVLAADAKRWDVVMGSLRSLGGGGDLNTVLSHTNFRRTAKEQVIATGEVTRRSSVGPEPRDAACCLAIEGVDFAQRGDEVCRRGAK
jgi:hypothetical protein